MGVVTESICAQASQPSYPSYFAKHSTEVVVRTRRILALNDWFTVLPGDGVLTQPPLFLQLPSPRR